MLYKLLFIFLLNSCSQNPNSTNSTNNQNNSNSQNTNNTNSTNNQNSSNSQNPNNTNSTNNQNSSNSQNPNNTNSTNNQNSSNSQNPNNNMGPSSSNKIAKSEIITETIGIFSYELQKSKQVVRFKKNNVVLSRKNFLSELADSNIENDNLRYLINKAITVFEVEKDNGLMLKSPPISKDHEDKEFFWLAQKKDFSTYTLKDTYKNYFAHCEFSFLGFDFNSQDYKTRFLGLVANSTVYRKTNLDKHQKYKGGSVFFQNTHKEDRLISPCPFNGNVNSEENKNLLHLRSYAQYLEETKDKKRINNFWQAIGEAAIDYEKNIANRIFLSTHGTGVLYLHFRIDSLAYDYKQEAANISSEPSADKFYQEVFNN
jgi:hypothetical protein